MGSTAAESPEAKSDQKTNPKEMIKYIHGHTCVWCLPHAVKFVDRTCGEQGDIVWVSYVRLVTFQFPLKKVTTPSTRDACTSEGHASRGQMGWE